MANPTNQEPTKYALMGSRLVPRDQVLLANVNDDPVDDEELDLDLDPADVKPAAKTKKKSKAKGDDF